MPSNSDYPALAELANMIALATNPHLVMGYDMDLMEPEQVALVGVLENAMAARIEIPTAFYEFLAESE